MIKTMSKKIFHLDSQENIFTVSNWTIFKKNFLAGIARSLGMWFFNIIILLLLVNLLIPLLGPKLNRVLNQLPKDVNEVLVQVEKNDH